MRATVIQSLVRRLLTYEAAESQDQAALIAAAERISEKLRAHLSKRIGQEGFRTLLVRSLTLTIPQFPSLSAARVEADGSLGGLQEIRSDAVQEGVVEGTVALLAHLLALLVTFIGEDLTLRLLSAVWPDMDLDDATGRENKNA